MVRYAEALVPISKLLAAGCIFWIIQRNFFAYVEPFAPFATQNAVPIWVALTVPFMGLILLAIGNSLDLNAAQAFHAFAIIAGVSLLLNGAVLAIEPGFYGESPQHRATVAALVIWSCGTGLALAYFWPGSGRFSALLKSGSKEPPPSQPASDN